jgi:2,6-dihydroxypyridine 3-monooxygenase
VIVIGGSIGGLTAALLLRDLGCDVTVLERSRGPLVSSGAGIVIHPMTVRYLLERAGHTLDSLSIGSRWERYMGPDGAVASERPCRFRFSSYSTLHGAALRAFDGARYRPGCEVVALEEHSVRLADGRSERADLVVCADGIHSLGRRTLVPSARARYAGYVGWRGTMPANRLADERLKDAITYHVMPSSHILTYPIPPGPDGAAILNWVWYRNVGAGAPLEALLTDRNGRRHEFSVGAGHVAWAHVDALRGAAAALPPPMEELVLGTEQPFVQAVHDIEVPRMAFGNACLIGDAAFVVRPHAGAGSAKAAEDAWTLAHALAAGDLATWDRRQVALGRSLLERTRATGERLQFTNHWRPGEPIPLGLKRPGDSAMAPA